MVKLSMDVCTNSFGVDSTGTGGSTCIAGTRLPGQLQAGATINTVVLEASSSSTDDFFKGYAYHGTDGVAEDDVVRITAYDGTTKVATLEQDLSGIPSSGDGYVLVRRDNACYNTLQTCQDIANYSPDPNIKEIYLTEAGSDFPIQVLAQANVAVAIPCLKKVKITPPRLELGRGLGLRSSVDVTCSDFPHADNGVDPYFLSRTYDPVAQGTFWGKFLARNPFYTGRVLTVFRGYLNADGSFDVANYRTWGYIIDRIDGVQTNDTIRITAKDALKKADDKKAQVPKPSTGQVWQTFASTDLDFTLFPVGIGDLEYPESGTMRINDEIFDFTRAANSELVVFDGVRGQYGTVASDHDAGDAVQLCVVYSSVNVVDIVQDLLDVSKRSDTNGLGNNAGMDTAILDLTGWTTERNLWLSSNLLTRVISSPQGVNTLLKELTEENMLYMWWDAINQLVKLRAIAPVREGVTLNDNEHFIENSIKVWEDQKLRVSQVWIYYGVSDWSEEAKKLENYKNLYVQIDTAQEAPNAYAEIAAKPIISRWITTEALAIQLSGRMLNIYGRNVKFMSFKLDNKDDINLGDPVLMSTRYLQDVDGTNKLFNMIITEENEVESGTTNQYKAQQFELLGNYGYIAYSHTGRLESSPAANQVVLDTRTSRWEDPSLVINIDNGICDGPDVDLDGISVADDFKDVPAWVDNILVDHVLHIHKPGAAYDNWTTGITAYDSVTKTITLNDNLPVGVVFGISTGDIYHVHLPEYTGSYILLETGDALLLEDSGFIILEDGSTQAATLTQKGLYAWICPNKPPDPPVFGDGTEAYKIL